MSEPPRDKKRGLGRGLGALMPGAPARPATPAPGPVPAAIPERVRTYFQAAIEDVHPSPE